MLNKNKIIILVVIIILIFGGMIGWGLMQKSKIQTGEVNTGGEETKEVLSISAVVSSVDADNNFLMVKLANQTQEVKVILSETTKLIKLESPFSPENPPPPGTQFTLQQTEITIKDFKEGDEIFIKTLKNIAGKTEFDDVDFIQILP